MSEEKKEEQPHPIIQTLGNVIILNRRGVVLRRMHLAGTRSIINGLRLDLEYLFGIPNVLRNPYMVFSNDENRPKGKTGKMV